MYRKLSRYSYSPCPDKSAGKRALAEVLGNNAIFPTSSCDERILTVAI